MRLFKKIVVISLGFLLIVLSTLVYGRTIAVSVPKLQYEEYKSTKISKELDGFQIAFISDLYFGENVTLSELDYLITTLHAANVDLVLFGGDLFGRDLSNQEYQAFLEVMNKLRVKHGMFAVNGDKDIDFAGLSQRFYEDYAVELLENELRKIYSEDGGFFYLIGLDSQNTSDPVLSSIYEEIGDTNFSLSFFHHPNVASNGIVQTSPLLLAGHTFGGQEYIPFISQFEDRFKGLHFINGKYYLHNSLLHVSNGVGTTNEKQRFLTRSEILIYTLKHKSVGDTNGSNK